MTKQYAEIVRTLSDPGGGGIFVQRRIPGIAVLDVFAARKIESGLEALLIHADPQLLPNVDDLPQSEGFHVALRPGEGKPPIVIICLELLSEKFRDVFLALATDIEGVLVAATQRDSAIDAVLRRLYRWQEFLQLHRPDGLQPEAQAGLFGELLILSSYFISHLDPAEAVRGWRGCRKAHQDFQHPGFALEVKTTRAVSPKGLSISNVQQLDDEGVNHFFLAVVSVHCNEASGRSLPELISYIRKQLPAIAASLFNEGLLEVGYLDIHHTLYQRTLYELREIHHYEVTGDFPRLRAVDLPNGVRDVSYQISLDACLPFLVAEDAVISAIHDIR